MAINKIDWPTASTAIYTPSISTDYNNQNENLERVVKGYNAVSLTNWDSAISTPQIISGSMIECNGVLYEADANTAIGTSGASDGTVYLTFNDAATPTFEWVNTEPTWSTPLNGWYISGNRFTGHFASWSVSGIFSAKREYISNKSTGAMVSIGAGGNITINDNAIIGGDVTASGDATAANYGLSEDYAATSQAIETVSTYTLPQGLHFWSEPYNDAMGGGNTISIQIYNGSDWKTLATYSDNPSLMLISNGSDIRIYNGAGTTETAYWVKM